MRRQGCEKPHHELPILQTAAPRSRGELDVTRSELGLEPLGLDLMTLKFADGTVQELKPALLSHFSSGRGTLRGVGSGGVRMGDYGPGIHRSNSLSLFVNTCCVIP